IAKHVVVCFKKYADCSYFCYIFDPSILIFSNFWGEFGADALKKHSINQLLKTSGQGLLLCPQKRQFLKTSEIKVSIFLSNFEKTLFF
ncbi:TPA: hypothetical protein ACGO22_002371, partial [Streptococcus suis]